MHEKIEKDSDIGSIFFKNFLYSFSSALFLLKLELINYEKYYEIMKS